MDLCPALASANSSPNAQDEQKLADELGSGATGAASTDAPAGRIVVLAVPFDATKELVAATGTPWMAASSSTPPTPLISRPLTRWSSGRAAPPRRKSPSGLTPGRRSSRRSTPPSPAPWPPERSPGSRWMSSSPPIPRTPASNGDSPEVVAGRSSAVIAASALALMARAQGQVFAGNFPWPPAIFPARYPAPNLCLS